MSEAVKVMGRLCQLAGGWERICTGPAGRVEGGKVVILGGLLWGRGECVHAVRYPGFTCLLPVLPRYDVGETEPAQGDRVGGVGVYTCHHV